MSEQEDQETNDGQLRLMRLTSGKDIVGVARLTQVAGQAAYLITNPAEVIEQTIPLNEENEQAYEMGEEALMKQTVGLANYQPYAATNIAVFPWHAIEAISDMHESIQTLYEHWVKSTWEDQEHAGQQQYDDAGTAVIYDETDELMDDEIPEDTVWH